ncbi:ABC transporter ATP-binding protein [Roseburia sp. 499]|uniref:ABC transporter ATP-binding protein n=1 Tax=Roseburia sp. 499 TaxID=1261634 RepID=UPI00095208D6|nr:ABC transporter ATP-binding protein [Roseburia sp. 499]WVK69560.1 ABC transporter ATP-binding protein [Roseburia sp. 499]
MDVIKVVNGSKSFGSHQVLKEVNITCSEGGIYGIIGRNGSGKTVLFKCICGFLTLDSGDIYIGEKRLKKDVNMLTGAGIIIEEPSFLRNYSGYKNLEFLYMIRNKRDKKHICDILEMVGLEPDSHKHVGNYSMGMRQRLAIAQAIMEDQKILILDEPMNGLDNHGVEEMRRLFLELKKEGKTILLASHNREDIEILCDEVYEMDGGILQRKARK